VNLPNCRRGDDCVTVSGNRQRTASAEAPDDVVKPKRRRASYLPVHLKLRRFVANQCSQRPDDDDAVRVVIAINRIVSFNSYNSTPAVYCGIIHTDTIFIYVLLIVPTSLYNLLRFLPRDATVMPQCMTSVRPSFRLSVTFTYRDHICWNTSKIILRLISLRFMLGLAPTRAIWCNENTPKIRVK